MTYLVLDVETVPRALEGLWDSPRDKLVGDWLAKHERVKPGLHSEMLTGPGLPREMPKVGR